MNAAAAHHASVFATQPALTQHVGPIGSQRQLGELSLVLSSMHITHDAHAHDDGYYLVVAPGDERKTIRVIEDYLKENENWPPRPARERLPFPESSAAPILMLLLAVFFFAATGPASFNSWFSAGTSDAVRILRRGEVFRAVTALTLHADALHLLGNVMAGSIFLAAVFRRLGPGRGIFFTLMGGVLGNLANAVLHFHGHRSIGASTAVFAAVGVLAATQLSATYRSGARRWTDWTMPIVGAFALLGMLGASPHSDLWAHFFGLLGGGLMGLVAVKTAGTIERVRSSQVHYGAAAAAIVLFSWMAAFLVARLHGI